MAPFCICVERNWTLVVEAIGVERGRNRCGCSELLTLTHLIDSVMDKVYNILAL